MTAKELYNKNKSELFEFFINKWMFRGIVGWLLAAIIFKFTLIEFIITAGIMLVYTTWIIRGEWRKYKQWLIIEGRKDKWKNSSR